MEYRKVGRSGLFLSSLSLGSWVTFKNQLGVRKATELMAHAYDKGVTFFDNAEAYGDGETEAIMGEALKNLKWIRDTYCVSSKVYWGGDKPTQKGLSRKHLVDACNNALKRLQVEYLDIYYCHRPDPDTPIIETVSTMHHLITQGKILYWGTSEWPADLVMKARSVAKQYNYTPPIVEQPQYNMFNRNKVEHEYRYLYKESGIGLTTWSPLESGILTGKYCDGVPSESRLGLEKFKWLQFLIEKEEGKTKLEKTKKLMALAQEVGLPLNQMSIAWCLKNKNVSTVLLGASNIEQLDSNLESVDKVDLLTDEVMIKIEEILQNKPEADPDWKAH
ncbi:MAG: aldo/keto reductase [Deltaproteobacteria bacterium]|nr:MAG: aldo/keto reductase [Deltaproteobacteria bacterium]TNF25955.1 MAG: aldo/keto reductase [Deltaproteobacteria bacterium]